jgi:YHS domain-containing protein
MLHGSIFPLTRFCTHMLHGFSSVSRLASLAASVVLLASGMSTSAHAYSSLTPYNENIVTDRISGIAIMGYDPVAYFTDNAAIQGSPRYEAVWKGVVWRFANAANKAVFERDPDVYAPVLGGHDPVGHAHGRDVTGNPHVFVIKNDQVYFFYNLENRDAFLMPATAMNK